MKSSLAATRTEVRDRIEALRGAMQRRGLSTWIAPTADPHLSEYLAPRWQTRTWLSGFTGSAGTLVVTADFAGLWVDGRYWVQADAELAGSGIDAIHVGGAASGAFVDWLGTNVAAGSTIGVDGATLALTLARSIESAIAARGAALRTDVDLVDEIWPQRPGLPGGAIVERSAQFEPVARATKLQVLRAQMRACGAEWHLLSSLDDIAWLLNLRGADVPYNPVFIAHALVGARRTSLYAAPGKVSEALRSRLLADAVDVLPYEQAGAGVAGLAAGATLLIDPRRVAVGLMRAVAPGVRVIEQINPTTLSKSRKTDAEVAHVRAAMEQDGAALCEFFAWLEAAVARGERVTELTIDERITAARARRAHFVSPSFPTIAGFNANGASPHYRATPESHAVICDQQGARDGLLLIDSGGQYENGTTDITRVIAVGRATDEQRRDFTLVLKGMIQLTLARFPRSTRSPQLDSLARAPIWSAGVDYSHGTGHGVGYFLNVHEGPQGISPHLAAEPQTAMEVGMITSNEPGIYRPGRWGVRIENLLLTATALTNEFGEFLGFETLTLCPIDARCIEPGLLRPDEVDWLDSYHRAVRARLAPLVDGETAAWLQRNTRPLAGSA